MSRRVPLTRIAARPSSIPVWVLVAGIVATATAAYYSEVSARTKDQIHFDNAVQQVTARITSRVDTYIALLRAGAGLFAASRDVTLDEFRQFAQRLDLRGRYPGMQGIGFAVRVSAEQLQGFLAGVRAEGRPDFHVWPDYPRDVYFPILYLEPQDRRNSAALGYDMFTEPIRRAAMEAAARSGTAAASGRVTLVQEIDTLKQPGFLIYAPVYAPAAANSAAAEHELRGFVYSPLRAGDFLSSVFAGAGEPLVAITVHDGSTATGDSLLFDSHPVPVADRRHTGRFARETRINVAGRSWTIAMKSLPEFEHSADARLLPWILAVGLLVTLGLAWATAEEVKARAAAEEAAARLRESEEALRASESKLLETVAAERQAHAEAAAANRAKDDFLATVSHELRTPLNAILGWTTMLTSGRLSDQQRRRALEVIARSARTQADLIEDLLDVSRIITGKMSIDMRPTGLAAPVRAALDAVRPGAEAKGIVLERRLAVDPAVLGDPDRLQQVAWNLLSNAIKFTPAGGRVTASLALQDGHAELRVSDTGIGISPSFLSHVFERFQQHDSSTTRTHGGMGLGLAIVRHLVEAHGGAVHAESAGEGQGATFIVRLPLRAAEPRAIAAGRQPAGEQAAAELTGLHALVVDDDEDARELMAQILIADGARVTTAASAAEALGILDRADVDILLADIGMPVTDGYALMRAVRGHTSEAVRSMPAIAVTAYVGEHDRTLATAAGFQAHMAKPVDVESLRAAVRQLITL